MRVDLRRTVFAHADTFVFVDAGAFRSVLIRMTPERPSKQFFVQLCDLPPLAS